MLVRSHHQNSQGCKVSICECGFAFGSGNGFPVWEAVKSEVTFPSLKKYLFSFNYDFNYKRKRSRSPPDRSCWYGRGRIVGGQGRDGNFWPASTLTPNHIVALVCCWSSRSTPRSEGEGREYPWEWTHAMAPRFHPEARVLFCVGSYGALNFLNPKNSSFDNNIGLWFFQKGVAVSASRQVEESLTTLTYPLPASRHSWIPQQPREGGDVWLPITDGKLRPAKNELLSFRVLADSNPEAGGKQVH